MRDVEIRDVLREKLNASHADENFLIVDEFGICKGTVRADLAVISDSLKGYEIKSDRDTLARLSIQTTGYSKVFDTVTLVAAEQHVRMAIQKIPDWWGINVITRDVSSSIKMEILREEQDNPSVDPFCLAELLWRDEILTILEKFHNRVKFVKKPKSSLWPILVSMVTLMELKDLVRECLMKRKNWRSDSRRTQCDENYPPCAKSLDSLFPLIYGRSRQYIYRPS
jgi:hypothetical protein